MKLAAIYNIWDGEEWLDKSVSFLKDHVDVIIGMVQKVSNFGESYNGGVEIAKSIPEMKVFEYDPRPQWLGMKNELEKRKTGIVTAREIFNCTHFLHVDCDEMHPEFAEAKQYFIDNELRNSVMKMYTYFGRQHLRFEQPDNYHVPFISEIPKNTNQIGQSSRQFRVDPTRGSGIQPVTEIPFFMHHFSWVRNDIERKIRNSSAKNNIEKTNVLELYNQAKPGLFVEPIFNQKLISVLTKNHIWK